jgi:cell fate regulator YaaT (PSP1 superfamily)
MEEQNSAGPVLKEPSMFDSPEWTGVQPVSSQKSRQAFTVGIRFQPVGKVYHYSADGFDTLNVGAWVIVDTARGRQMGQVATHKPPKNHGGPYKRIERLATGRDMAMRHYYENKELEAMIAARSEAADLRLPVKIVRAEYSFDGQTLTFLYSVDGDERVEVPQLRDRMSRLYQARIEARQISPREVAKILGGMGACGIEERCCSKFLTDFSPISIKHAKEQNLSLNPNDITGMCGRLRCCLVYEFEQYVEARKNLPKLKSMIGTPSGPGKVVEILHLRDSIKVRIGEGMDARDLIFHREQLTPLEELKRLQEKAMSGTCDRHEGGGCDCGRKSKPVEARTETPDTDVTPAPVDADGRPAPRPAREIDPERAAKIKIRQEKIKAKLADRQKKREELRKQLKAKAARSDGAPEPQQGAERPERGEALARPDRPDRPERSDRRPARQERRRDGRDNREQRPQGQGARPDERRERPAQSQPQQRQPDRGQRRPLARRRPNDNNPAPAPKPPTEPGE